VLGIDMSPSKRVFGISSAILLESISLLIILPSGPVPLNLLKSRLFSLAIFFTKGDAFNLSSKFSDLLF